MCQLILFSMKKLNKKQIEKMTEKLKPFWKEHQKLEDEFYGKEMKLQEKLNKKLKPFTKLEFFHCDEGCIGIGAEDYSDRKFFPLIFDTDLNH